jgi:hypothetical protein
MAKHTTICAGIDTGKRKLDVAIDGRAEQLQVNNTVGRTQKIGRLAAATSGEADRHRGERRLFVAELRPSARLA